MFFGRFSSKRAAAIAINPAHQAAPDLREMARRAVARDIIDFHTVVAVEGSGAFDARLMDISPYGCQVRAYGRVFERGERIWVLLPIAGEVAGEAMWGLKGLFGCKFIEPIDEVYAEILPQLRGSHPGLSERN